MSFSPLSWTNMVIKLSTRRRQQRFTPGLMLSMVEFNKASQSLTDVVVPITQKKVALSRLLKDNVALIAVLEEKFSNHGADTPGKRQLLCVGLL
ncbi:hypothetical protein C5167_049923 [Papaver somniferum]|uniref:Uncharacterized protein n=1 Tax=Papaver somniferum TaxID=3469 RepID=A0A4Y7KRC5_PAPSO|nr:hypothetical protein C5167_049923 [Papaver somniferum]